MAEKNTISNDEFLDLLKQVESELMKLSETSEPLIIYIREKANSVISSYIGFFSNNIREIFDTEQLERRREELSFVLGFLKDFPDDKISQFRVAGQISYWLDELYLSLFMERGKPDSFFKRLELQNTKVIHKIETSSKELDEQVLKAKDINQLLQSQYEKTSSDLQASNLEQLQKIQEQSNNLKPLFEEQVKNELDNFNALVGKANELHNFMQGRALSDFFAKRAVEEKTSARNWTIATWGFASATLVAIFATFVYQVLYFSPENKGDLSLLGTKVLFTATLGLIAKWTSKRANRHLAEESKYHRLSINISTIDSFVEKLDEKARHEVLAAVAMKTFTEVSGNETATDFETASVLDFIKGVLPKADGK